MPPKLDPIYQAACLPVLFLAVRMWVLWYWTQRMFRLWRQRSLSCRNSQFLRTHLIVPENTRSLSLMDVNAFLSTGLHSHPIDPRIIHSLLSARWHTLPRVGKECSAVHPQGSSAFFFSKFLSEKCDLDTVSSSWWCRGRLNGVTVACSRRRIKADTLSSTIGADSSHGLLGFIIPLLCLNLYHRGQAVLHL